ncbi:unnamed protein product [Polarella glacialis]|uniref:Uncharacterized protein n=1 Tax=Polarella glacialis TaxID=89957 RepID=A0A813I446_POLGL|nr:unnamed protein product [Polarella glacialis]
MPSFSVKQLLQQSMIRCCTLAIGSYSDLEFHDTGCDDETIIFTRPEAIHYMLRDLETVCRVPMVGIMMCSFKQEGRGSTASQRTDGELAPIHAAGKVPVPCGRECQRETARPQPWFRR